MMDIWEWFGEASVQLARDGHIPFARGLHRLPSLVCDDRHAEADALVPELLASARALDLPWFEVFVRHWHLQSRVLHRMEGESALADAVSLVEFSHRDNHKGCPQSVCSVQDLTACYGFVDGPGYAEERLDVSRETLARIDPSWACFSCITGEHADALVDAGRPEDALRFIDAQVATAAAANKADALWTIGHQTRMDVLHALGRHEALLDFLEGCKKNGRTDSHDLLRTRIHHARALAGLGRFDEAAKALPAAREIEKTPAFYPKWTAAVHTLASAGAWNNDRELDRTLRDFVSRLLKQGVFRHTLHIAESTAALALDRGAPHMARRSLRTMREVAAKLRAPLDALDRIARIAQRIAATSLIMDLPDSPEKTCDLAATHADPEAALGLMERAAEAWPDDPAVTSLHAHMLDVLGLSAEAIEVLSAAVARGSSARVATQLGSMLAEAGELDRAEKIGATLLDLGEAARAHFVLARVADQRGDNPAAAAHVDAILAIEPDRVPALQMRVEIARKMQDFASMLVHLEALLARVDRPALHWDRMLAATIVGQWARVRSSARALGMAFEESDDPIDEEGRLCRVRFAPEGEEREPAELWARRTGPVTARILQITGPERPSRVGDLIAFDATPLNAPPASEGDAADHTWLYPHVATLSRGNFATFAIDGVHPGEQAWEDMRRAISQVGAVVQTQSGDSYKLTRPGQADADEEGEQAPGLYALVAVPPTIDAHSVHACLLAATAGLPDPIVWPALAKAAGDEEVHRAHADLTALWKW